MVDIRDIEASGSDLLIHFVDGSVVTAFGTGGKFWVMGAGSISPPDDGFRWPFPRADHTTYPGHSGSDWPGAGMVVHAVGPGVVEATYAFAGNTYPSDSSEPVWRGNCIVINHGTIGGVVIWSLYAHLRDAPAVSVGAAIAAGQAIGVTGDTGYSDGDHLHFEIIFNGSRLSEGMGGYERTMGWMDANASGEW